MAVVVAIPAMTVVVLVTNFDNNLCVRYGCQRREEHQEGESKQ
jgi:hypothetical protein